MLLNIYSGLEMDHSHLSWVVFFLVAAVFVLAGFYMRDASHSSNEKTSKKHTHSGAALSSRRIITGDDR